MPTQEPGTSTYAGHSQDPSRSSDTSLATRAGSPSPTAASSATTGTPSSSAIATAKTVIASRPTSSTAPASPPPSSPPSSPPAPLARFPADGQPAVAQPPPDVRPLFLGVRPRGVAPPTSGPPAQRRLPQHGTTAPLLPREAASQTHGAHQPQLRMAQPPNIRGCVQPGASAAGPASTLDPHSVTAAEAPLL